MQKPAYILCMMAFLIALSPTGKAVAQTVNELETQLKAEQAAMDSLNARIAAELQRPQPSSEAANQSKSGIKEALISAQNVSQNLADEINNTEQQLRQAESQLKNREQNIAQRAREIYKIGRQGILAVLFSAKSLRDVAQRMQYLSRLKDRDQQDVLALQAARKRVSILYTILSSQKQRQQILLQHKRKYEQILKR